MFLLLLYFSHTNLTKRARSIIIKYGSLYQTWPEIKKFISAFFKNGQSLVSITIILLPTAFT